MASKIAMLALLQGTQAATYSADMTTMPCFGATTAADSTVYNGQYCLNPGSWSAGKCCDTSEAVPADGECAAAPHSDGAAYTPGLAFCGTKSTISNRFLREFLMPQDTTYCPADMAMIQINEEQTIKSIEFNTQVPTSAAAAWHCKYGMTTTTKIPDGTAEASRGYVYLKAENFGFDNNVIVIIQPRGKWLDFNFRSQTQDPEKFTKVFKSVFGRKYIIPAEYDIFLDFAPISYARNSQQVPLSAGKFDFLAKWVPSITDEMTADDTVTIVKRLASPDAPIENEVIVPVEEPEETDGAFEPTDDTVLPDPEDRVSEISDGTIADKWKSWKDDEAFYGVTNEEAAVGSAALIIVIVGVACICCFVSYLERKKIAEEARRASAYAKRASQKVRRSIKAMRGQDPGPEEPEAPKTGKEIKKMAAENASNKNEKAFLNDMFTEQQKADAEAAAAAENA